MIWSMDYYCRERISRGKDQQCIWLKVNKQTDRVNECASKNVVPLGQHKRANDIHQRPNKSILIFFTYK